MKMKIKTLLVSVLMEKNSIISEEIGICSIAAYLESKGCDVKVINSTRNYLCFEDIYQYEPDIIGFPVYSTTEKIVGEIAAKIKEHLPSVKICYGGYWPTLNYTYLLKKYPQVDYIIQGEGEIAFYNLIKALENGTEIRSVKSLVFRDKEQYIANEREPLISDLDALPFPKRSLLKNNMLRYAYVSTSRGCNANCSFCWHRKFWGSGKNNLWRGRSVDSIIEELHQLVDKYHIDRFWFIDDSFEDCPQHDSSRMWEIAKRIIDEGFNISYETYMRSEVHRILDDEKMMLLKDSGFVGVIFGTESGNKEDLKLYNKIATVEDNLKSIELFRKHDIAVDIGFINFNPYSTIDNLYNNVKFLFKTEFGSVLYYFVERCGITRFSAIYNRVKKDGLLIEDKDSECHSYRYVNEDVGELSNFLYYRYHENDSSKEYFYAKKIGSYIREEFKLLNHIKRYYRNRYDIISCIHASEQIAWELLHEVCQSNTQWFIDLLTMLEHGWDRDKAEKISEQYLNLSKLKGYSDKLEQNRLGLYLKLNKLGVAPSEYFNFE